MAWRFTSSVMAMASARSDFMNFNRAGVAKNRSRTSTRAPCGPGKGAGCGAPTSPPSTVRAWASPPDFGREVRVSRATDPIEGRASPRKPRVEMCSRSHSPCASG